jgi:hypothetical protein
MAITYEPIATSTIVGTGTSTVTFSSFSGYTDIRLIIFAKSNSGSADTLKVAVNTSTSISRTYLIGNGSTASAGRQSSEPVVYADDIPASSSSSYNFTSMDFLNYSNTTTFKTVLIRSGSGDWITEANVGLFRSTSAITSIRIFADTNAFASSSTFTLYGIAAA